MESTLPTTLDRDTSRAALKRDLDLSRTRAQARVGRPRVPREDVVREEDLLSLTQAPQPAPREDEVLVAERF